MIVDGDLQFGDVAVLLGVPPTHTTIDAAAAIDQADTSLMDSFLATHPATGLRVLPAPVEPSAADSISPEQMLGIVRMLRAMCAYVIVDMPPHFDDVVLALLEEADDVLLVASMDIPSIKNLKVGIQTLGLLSLAGPKLRLVLNRPTRRSTSTSPMSSARSGSRCSSACLRTSRFRRPSTEACPSCSTSRGRRRRSRSG